MIADGCAMEMMKAKSCLAVVDAEGGLQWRAIADGSHFRSLLTPENGDIVALSAEGSGLIWRATAELNTRYRHTLDGMDDGLADSFLFTTPAVLGLWSGGLLAVSSGAADGKGHPIQVGRMDAWGNLACGKAAGCFSKDLSDCYAHDGCTGLSCLATADDNGGRFHFIFTPIHASWLNQVECFFSIVNRRIIQRADFKSVADATTKIVNFIDFWNKFEAHPFRWTWRYQARDNGAAKAA